MDRSNRSDPDAPMMKNLHSWQISAEKAIQIQEALGRKIILKRTFAEVRTIGGGDVAYSGKGDELFGAIVVLSFPSLETVDAATAFEKVTFPYIPGLFSFREGPVLIRAFKKVKIRPDVMIFDGQGIAHPKGFGLASHLGLWLDLPSIGCAKSLLLGPGVSNPILPGPGRGSFEFIEKGRKAIAAVLRTRESVKPVFVSPGHRIDLQTSIELILASCRGYRIPEPLRRAHHLSCTLRTKDTSGKSPSE